MGHAVKEAGAPCGRIVGELFGAREMLSKGDLQESSRGAKTSDDCRMAATLGAPALSTFKRRSGLSLLQS